MRFPLCLAAALLLVAACDRSPVDPLPTETSFTFEYRLGDGGSFQSFAARGQQPPGTSLFTPGPWVATGSAGAPHQRLVLNAYQQVGGRWQDFWVVVSAQPGVDTIALGHGEAGTCPGEDGRPCTETRFRMERAGGATEVCRIVTGEMILTRTTTEWVSARFSGTGTCTSAAGERAFEVRDGAFDIALPPPAAAPG